MNGIAQLLFEDFFFVHGLLSKRRAGVSKQRVTDEGGIRTYVSGEH